MTRIKGPAVRVSRARREPLHPSRGKPRNLTPGRLTGHTVMVWIEDHAEPLILSTLLLLSGTIITLLLWKTARVISLAREFEPVLAAIAALTTISLAVLNLLKSRRDRRLKDAGKPELATGPPAPPTSAPGS